VTRGWSRGVLTAATLAGLVGLAACSGGGSAIGSANTSQATTTTSTVPPTTTTTLPALVAPGALAVGVRNDTYVDPSRPTPANGGAPGAPNRSMLTTVWYPATGAPGGAAVSGAAPDLTHGPYPLIVFAHGFAVTPRTYAALLIQWAAAGYVVVAPALPLLNGDAPGGAVERTDYVGPNIADLDFVLGDALRRGVTPGDPLAGLIDGNRVAVAGHSDGELLAYELALLPCCHDNRVKAVIPMAGNLANANVLPTATGVPALHIMDDHDRYDPYPASIAFDRQHLPAPKAILTLVNAGHDLPFEQPSDPHFDLVVHATVDFLDATLKGHPEAAGALQTLVSSSPSLAALESTPSQP
jgi:pimeloyl-ACP methyl ester carboxylesterase